ncbi:MAG: nuclear transport factor 2 family protein [Candidatus Krumholzibacteria bacterium]|nr:nuclear transport factor 2 family protein [Candidatus Krumholzibacteria bacterium]
MSLRSLARFLLVGAALCAAVLSGPVAAQESDARAQLQALEARRLEAMRAADVKALAQIMAEDMTYAHSTGLVQTRDQLLQLLESGLVRYLSFETHDIAWRVYDGAAVATGRQTISLESDGRPITARNRITVVYARIDADWRCVAYQSTTLPEMKTQEKTR